MTTVTVLMDNLGQPPYIAEHGLSFFVEVHNGPVILFDTGASDKFIVNARTSACDLRRVDCVVLSHGHYDHAGGFPSLAASGICRPLWTGSGFFAMKYRIHNQEAKKIGSPFTQDFLEEHQIPWKETCDSVCELYPGVWLMSGFTELDDYTHVSDEFFVNENGSWRPDTFHDEVMLVCDGSDGLTVIAGCCHPGVVSMLNAVRQHFQRPIQAFMGGMHLSSSGRKEMEETVAEVCSLVVGEIGACHCTGKKARAFLAAERKSYVDLHSGARVTCG